MELQHLNDKQLQEQAVFFKNFALMNDFKITTQLIRLDARKRSYCNIVKLTLPKINKPNNHKVVTKPDEIRKEMATHFQKSLTKQEVD